MPVPEVAPAALALGAKLALLMLGYAVLAALGSLLYAGKSEVAYF